MFGSGRVGKTKEQLVMLCNEHRINRIFSDLACGVLNQCYTDRPDETDRILTRKRPRWRNLTCLEIAYQMKIYSFMTHDACKISINRGWFGKISAKNNSIQMMSSVFVLGLLPFVLRFEESDEEKASYIVFLGFFSYALLTGFGDKLTYIEYQMCFWLYCVNADLKKRLGPNFPQELSWSERLEGYFTDKWNYFDFIVIIFFPIGMSLNLSGFVEAGRVLLAISQIAFFMRTMKAFLALKELGPKIWMIAAMVNTQLLC
uniref:Transient receptor potential cation channel subfamily M member 2 n=1 Tax=Magallana gigas TaxID=29159 RepID=K1PE08_MAGGI